MICSLSIILQGWKDLLALLSRFAFPEETCAHTHAHTAAGFQTHTCHLFFRSYFSLDISSLSECGRGFNSVKSLSEHLCSGRIPAHWQKHSTSLPINIHTHIHIHTHTHTKWVLGSNIVTAIRASWPCVECNNGKGNDRLSPYSQLGSPSARCGKVSGKAPDRSTQRALCLCTSHPPYLLMLWKQPNVVTQLI